jgi:PAS domain S-box-containing protein
MTETLGYPKNELIGKELSQIGLFRNEQASRDAVRHLQEHGYIRYDHLPLETADGRQVDVEFVSNVYQEDHRPVIQCNVRDITARRQLERVKAHTEALADLHRRKDEFLAMLSHELRNPLAPLLNAVYILGSEPGTESPMRRQARAIIERQVGVLKVLVDDLLEVSRITTGRVRLHQERLDLRNVLAQAVESARSVINQHQHALTVEQPPEAIWLHGDATRLEQVVVNLLTNAAKYTTDKGRITVTLRREGTVAVLRVRDTGEGISPDFVPHVFDLYSQADQSLERSGGSGSG